MRREIGEWWDAESRNTKQTTDVGKASEDIGYVEKDKLCCTECEELAVESLETTTKMCNREEVGRGEYGRK